MIHRSLKPIGGLNALRFPPLGSSHAIEGFHIPRQEQTNWCWSAVAKGVAARRGAVWQQCNIAALELGQSCCPTGSNPGACNVPWYLDRALMRVGRFGSMIGRAANLATEVIPEINANRPMCVRIGWSGGGGHFIAIAGYSTIGPPMIEVEDPWYSASTVSWSVLQSGYQGTGTWTHSYWTV